MYKCNNVGFGLYFNNVYWWREKFMFLVVSCDFEGDYFGCFIVDFFDGGLVYGFKGIEN